MTFNICTKTVKRIVLVITSGAGSNLEPQSEMDERERKKRCSPQTKSYEANSSLCSQKGSSPLLTKSLRSSHAHAGVRRITTYSFLPRWNATEADNNKPSAAMSPHSFQEYTHMTGFPRDVLSVILLLFFQICPRLQLGKALEFGVIPPLPTDWNDKTLRITLIQN